MGSDVLKVFSLFLLIILLLLLILLSFFFCRLFFFFVFCLGFSSSFSSLFLLCFFSCEGFFFLPLFLSCLPFLFGFSAVLPSLRSLPCSASFLQSSFFFFSYSSISSVLLFAFLRLFLLFFSLAAAAKCSLLPLFLLSCAHHSQCKTYPLPSTQTSLSFSAICPRTLYQSHGYSGRISHPGPGAPAGG